MSTQPAQVADTSSSFWDREPAVLVSAVVTLLSLAAAFGFALTQRQTVAITSAVFAVASLIGGFATRQKVAAPATLIRIQNGALNAIAAAQADKANIIAAIATSKTPSRTSAPAPAPDPAPAVVETPAALLASVPPAPAAGIPAATPTVVVESPTLPVAPGA